jgi:hypothetical protein
MYRCLRLSELSPRRRTRLIERQDGDSEVGPRSVSVRVEVRNVYKVNRRAVFDCLEAATRVEVADGLAGVVSFGDGDLGRGGKARGVGAAGRLVGCDDR